MKYVGILILLAACASSSKNNSPLEEYLSQGQIFENVLAPEGEYIKVYSPKIKPFIQAELDQNRIKELKELLKESLKINLTSRGFAKAAERNLKEGEKDETNYDAIWVRDSAWIYFYFSEIGEKEKARKLILALWDYYSSQAQVKRIRLVLKNPKLALDGTMNVPHIRFNGNSKDFDDVMLNGKPEVWNHRQNDAHGLFLLGLAEAYQSKIISLKDFSVDRVQGIKYFPRYFKAIEYQNYPGAGAWEEISKVNTSSVSMVVKALENWKDVLRQDEKVSALLGWKNLNPLIKKGYARIRINLSLGGEASNHDPKSLEFRREDAALFNIFLPMPLKQITKDQKQQALLRIEKLIRPFGVLRYQNDSYQSGNYWIKPKTLDGPTATGDSSSSNDFLARFKKFMPDSEAQWFFDSKIAMIYMQLYGASKNAQEKKIYQRYATIHLKRALGMITGNRRGEKILAADGKEVRELQFPESINTIEQDGKRFYLPSPITPLNWAKASAGMMLERSKVIFQ